MTKDKKQTLSERGRRLSLANDIFAKALKEIKNKLNDDEYFEFLILINETYISNSLHIFYLNNFIKKELQKE